MADYSDGLANFAAAIGNYMAARKRRKMEQEDREDRKLEREERRRDIDEDRKFKREMATADMDFRREYLDRVAPKKDMLDRIMEGVKGILPAQVTPQDRLINSQAMYNERLAGLLGTPGMAGAGFPTTVPIGGKSGSVGKPPKAPKEPRVTGVRSGLPKDPQSSPGMVDLTRVMRSTADQFAAGIHRYFRENNQQMTPEVVGKMNLKNIIMKNIGKIEQRWNRKLSEADIEALEESLRYSLMNKVPASGGAR